MPLDFRGDFYSHTLMTPFFAPSRNPHGTPPVYLAEVGDLMTQVAGEVAEGFLAHGFTTERYLREVTVPVLRKARGGDLSGYEIVGSPLVVTGETDEALAAAARGVRDQIAFYGSTPAYRPVLDCTAGAISAPSSTISRAPDARPRWARPSTTKRCRRFAVIGAPEEIAPQLQRRFGDLMTRAALYTPYDIDPAAASRIAAELSAL